MAFADFLNQAWRDHAEMAEGVADRLEKGIALVEREDQIPALAQLITHVTGEHLGRWEFGVGLLNRLRSVPAFVSDGESAMSLDRAVASLEMAAGRRAALESFTRSDQIRVLATAASALNGRLELATARSYFAEALELAREGLAPGDPANRALAVIGNNLACSLEERPSRSPEETEFMKLAAETARQYWEIAGTWLEVERAEYRLSRTFLKAGDPERALWHAQMCLEISTKNQAPALELFFGYEALATVEKSGDNRTRFVAAVAKAHEQFTLLGEEDKGWCASSLETLRS